jgi:hypothetical protein
MPSFMPVADSLVVFARHSREGGNDEQQQSRWIAAFAGNDER